MMGDVISSATGAVASLPAMVIQRANPGLYELLTNGTLQANAYFDKAQLNCQAMSKKLADHTLSGPWVQAAVGEEYQNALSGTSDAVKADQQLSKSTGTEGVSWVGGKKRGGKGQAAIRPTHDIARPGTTSSISRRRTAAHPLVKAPVTARCAANIKTAMKRLRWSPAC